jgi:hypothetical protein
MWRMPWCSLELPIKSEANLGRQSQPHPNWVGCALGRRLYESIHPLEDALVARLGAPLRPLCAVAGLSFERNADVARGAWRNFFVGLLGDVADAEDDVLWPNQVRPHVAVMGLLLSRWCGNSPS